MTEIVVEQSHGSELEKQPPERSPERSPEKQPEQQSVPQSHSNSTGTNEESNHFINIDQTSNDTSENLSIEELLKKDQAGALEAKRLGNECFAQQKFDEAVTYYERAIILCEDSDTTNKAIFLLNRAAAYLMLKQYDSVVSDCTESIKLNSNQPKAFFRRAKAHHQLENYQEGVTDMQEVVKLDPSNVEARTYLQQLTVLQQQKFDKQKDEMLGKLKDLGNGLLGKFGLSLDNFKYQQDPKTGAYSINFQK